jgi:arsenite methyltransferase
LRQQAISDDAIRGAVAERYSTIGSNPFGEDAIPVGRAWAERLGYPVEMLDSAPAVAVASFTGIGAPVLYADLVPGERILDVGCGAGLDMILMARKVAPDGYVYGIDLAPGMVAAARQAVAKAGLENATIKEASAEAIPLPDAAVDVAVVNGLFNLAPDKGAVVSELRRVLRPGGRLVGAEIAITDDRAPGDFDPESWFR